MYNSPVTVFVLFIVSVALSLWLSRRRRKLYGVLLTFWALVFVAMFFAPALQTAAWHLRHGGGIEYRGKWIPVPARWVADSKPQGATLTKLPVWTLAKSPSLASISISLFGIPKYYNAGKNRREWEKLFRLLHSGPDSVVSGPRELDTASGRAPCMEFYGRQTPNRLEASCLMFGGKWTADFLGGRADSRTFFRIVKSIR